MNKTSRVWLDIASVIALISGIGLFVLGLFLIFDIMGTGTYYVNVLKDIMPALTKADINFYKVTMAINFVFSIFINIFSVVVYLKTARVKYPTYSHYRVVLNTSIINLLFGLTALPGLIALIVILNNNHLKRVVVTPEDNKSVKTDVVKDIKELKEKLNNKLITEQEYNELLDKAILNSVKQNDKTDKK